MADEIKKGWKLPQSRPLRFAILFFSELFSFFVISCNFRALALGLYIPTALTDMVIVVNGVIMTKLMVEDEKARDTFSIVAFAIGGACGSLLSIYFTKHVFGK